MVIENSLRFHRFSGFQVGDAERPGKRLVGGGLTRERFQNFQSFAGSPS